MTDVASFIPRFVSERPLPYVECSMDVGVMGAESSSLNACTVGLSKDQMIALVGALRTSVGVLSGGQSIGQVDRAIQMKWPDIPPMARPIGDTSGTRLTPADFKDRLAHGYYALVCGNPSRVTNTSSLLRQWQTNDNYNHGIGATDYDPSDDSVAVQDPLGGWSYPNGTGAGYQRIPLKELLQFAWRTPDGAVYCGIWLKGAAVPAPAEPPPVEPTTPPPTEDPVLFLATNLTGYSATVKANTNVRPTPDRSGAPIRLLTATETWIVVGFVKGELVSGSDQWLMRYSDAGEPEFVHSSTLAGAPAAPVTEADYTAKTIELSKELADATATIDKIKEVIA